MWSWQKPIFLKEGKSSFIFEDVQSFFVRSSILFVLRHEFLPNVPHSSIFVVFNNVLPNAIAFVNRLRAAARSFAECSAFVNLCCASAQHLAERYCVRQSP